MLSLLSFIGYDPGLSVQSALRLPRSLHLEDSIISAVADADYISLNIPYIKGENGTHGIIGPDVIEHFKPKAVLLNFARGELVDSEAMKKFLDDGDGRYVTDFPDDLLWDHKNAIILPHLGASTVEAEDAAVSLTIFYYDGDNLNYICNSNNFFFCVYYTANKKPGFHGSRYHTRLFGDRDYQK